MLSLPIKSEICVFMKTEKVKPIELSKQNQSLLVLCGFSCNNNCIVCSVRTKEANHPDRSFNEITEDLKRGIKSGYRDVEFTGGETTIRSDIIQLVKEAKRLGYGTIAISTNGRLFSYEKFCREIIEAGLNKITFSLLGYNEAVHTAVTRTPGSFRDIIRGIKNAQRFSNVHLNISSVISRLNVKNIRKFGLFVLSCGIRHWYLLDLIPDGNAEKMYYLLAVDPKMLSAELNNLIGISSKFYEIGFFDFPLCLFEKKFLELPNARFINAKQRLETSLQVGYNPSRARLNSEGVCEDFYKRRASMCSECKFYRECGGIWNNYLKLFGAREFKRMAKRHGTLLDG
jgi:MoaA/NifB/PqqE/SkfB family radical SAM enzyme